jgi:magnesium chelatase accessory protein
VLLLHGTGAATHSWRGLAPLLAPHAHLLAPDLPGHAFTDALPPGRCSLPGMAAALTQLLADLKFEPDLVLGHSAGAALMLRMALDDAWQARPRLVSLNGALMPFEGLAGLSYAPMARLLSRSAWVPRLVAWRGDDERAVQRLIGSTGSHIDAAGVAQYRLLMSSPGHVAGALAMMAHWDLQTLLNDLPRLGCPLLLLAAAGDTAVPPAQAQRVALRLPAARLQMLPGLGHLAHEEAPARLADVVLKEVALARLRGPANDKGPPVPAED